jgi:hypothetical protein
MRDVVSHSDSPTSIPRVHLPGWIRLAGRRLRTWIEVRADRAAEAAIYKQQLSALSDAELERRGIPRGDLHRCVARKT